MNLLTEPYTTQVARWPQTGCRILAQFNEESVVVYQAYRPSIGHFAARHHYFGGEFSFTRMSWIKPNFLWMMSRSGWGMKEGQEVILAVWLQRAAFESILAQAVRSTFSSEIYANEDQWRQALVKSNVRLQWDPDRDPSGMKLERRAIQLGLCGNVLTCYAREWIINIEDISAFVQEQYQHIRAHAYDQLVIPQEIVYSIVSQ